VLPVEHGDGDGLGAAGLVMRKFSLPAAGPSCPPWPRALGLAEIILSRAAGLPALPEYRCQISPYSDLC